MIYVDEATWSRATSAAPRVKYCHMVADTLEELHAFAKNIGVGRHWFHRSSRLPHYDLSEVNRELAILNGAKPVSRREFLVLAKGMK